MEIEMDEKEIAKRLEQMKERHKKSLLVFEGTWTTPIPEEIMRTGAALTDGAFRLWCVLRYHARRQSDEPRCFPSRKTLSEFLGVSEVQVAKRIDELKRVGLLIVERKARAVGYGVYNVYTMKNTKKWWEREGRRRRTEGSEERKKKYRLTARNGALI